MKLKEVLKFEKENMPDFQWKFEKFLFAFLAVWLGGALLALCAALIIGAVSGEDGVWYVPVIIWACALAGMLITLIIKSKKVKPKLIRYHTDNLLREFYDLDYSEARQKMLDGGKITEEGFIVSVEDGKSEIIPFDEVKIAFEPRFWGGKLFLNIALADKNDRVFADCMDNGYYNFLIRHTGLIVDKYLFELFDKDKEKFVKTLLRNNDAFKIETELRAA